MSGIYLLPEYLGDTPGFSGSPIVIRPLHSVRCSVREAWRASRTWDETYGVMKR